MFFTPITFFQQPTNSITPGSSSIFGSTGANPAGIAIDSAGNIYTQITPQTVYQK